MPLLDSSSGPRGSESIAPFLIRASTTVRSASQNFNQIQKASFDGFWSKFAIYLFGISSASSKVEKWKV